MEPNVTLWQNDAPAVPCHVPWLHSAHPVRPTAAEKDPGKHVNGAGVPRDGATIPIAVVLHDVSACADANVPSKHLKHPPLPVVALETVPLRHGKYDGLPKPGE